MTLADLSREDAARRTPEEVAQALSTDLVGGLSATSAAERLAAYGRNVLGPPEAARWPELLRRQLSSALILLLVVATVLSAALGEWLNAGAIAASVVISVAFGFLNELGSDRTIAALHDLTALRAQVVRGGHHLEVSAEEVVLGDLLVVAEGESVAADARVVVSRGLVVNEAILTGESVPVEKHVDVGPAGATEMLLFAGTTVAAGSAHAIVIATGGRTILGDIATATERKRPTTPLEARLERLGGRLVAIFLVTCIAVAVLGVASGRDAKSMVELAISLAIGAVPEGLPAVATAALAVAVRRLAAQKVLVRRLDAVETLGSTTVIVSDKTGTLTENRIAVRSVILPSGREIPVQVLLPTDAEVRTTIQADATDHEAVREVLRIGALCNDAVVEHDARRGWHALGDPLEGALMLAALGAGFDPLSLETEYPRSETIAFTSARRIMETMHETDDGPLIALKGALEQVSGLTGGATRELQEVADAGAAAGHRLIAVAAGGSPADARLLGVVVLEDPIRADAGEAVTEASASGVRLILATGDHLQTATTVARDVGLLNADGKAVEASDLGDADLRGLAVVARATHQQKEQLVTALRRSGEVVAMLGDGVNDAPAMRSADVAVAVGEDATDVAVQAAHVVITDGRLLSLVAGIREGRQTTRGLRQAIVYLLTASFATIAFIAATIPIDDSLPLAPLQILWLNLVVHLFPALALATGRDAVVTSRHPTSDLVSDGTWIEIAVRALTVAAGGIALLLAADHHDESAVVRQAIAFTTLGAMLVGQSLLIGVRRPSLQAARLRRPGIWLALWVSAGLLVAGLYLPRLRELLVLDPLDGTWLAAIAVVTVVTLNAGQMIVFALRRLLVHGDEDTFA